MRTVNPLLGALVLVMTMAAAETFGQMITGRPIRGPANQQLPHSRMFGVDMQLGVRVRM
jgi:hypothetical protein